MVGGTIFLGWIFLLFIYMIYAVGEWFVMGDGNLLEYLEENHDIFFNVCRFTLWILILSMGVILLAVVGTLLIELFKFTS